MGDSSGPHVTIPISVTANGRRPRDCPSEPDSTEGGPRATGVPGPLAVRIPYPGSPVSSVPSSRGLGHHPLKVATRVRIPLGLPTKYQFSGHAGPRIFVLAILSNTRTQHKTQQGSGEFDGRKHSSGQ
jgi:hypothetical protein